MLVRFKPEIIIDKDIILKRMKVKENSAAYKHILKEFDEQLETLKSIVNFEAVYLLKKNNNIFNIEEINNCENIVFCFTSIGQKANEVINKHLSDGNYIEGYMLNAISDELVMSATRQMQQYIKKEVKKDGYNLTKRYSPGECGLDIKYQEIIINEIKKETEINAYLTESYMIVPEKSTFFMYGVDKGIPETSVDHDCSNCTRENCPYRKL